MNVYGYHLQRLRSILNCKLSSLSRIDEERGFIYPFPRDAVNILTSKSSGPGGQHIQSTQSKVAIRINVENAKWISERTKASLQSSNLLSNKGNLSVYSERSKSQMANKSDCIKKLHDLLVRHSYVIAEPSQEEITMKLEAEKQYKEKIKQRQRTEKFKRNRDNLL